MIQGEGIIDLVNTYLVVALSRGLVGFVLFVGVFASALHATFKRWRLKGEDGGESKDFGRGLMAAMAVMLVTIGTSSPIFAIPTVYWLLTGFCVAYSGMMRWEYVSQGSSAKHETR